MSGTASQINPMESGELVSVLIPTYNRAGELPSAIESVLAQSYQPVEVVVVDDGSTDGTETLVRGRYPQVRYLRQTNRGPAAARNAGIKAASGRYIAFLDSDDRWTPRKLEQQIGLFRTRPDVGLVFSSVRFVNRRGRTVDERRYDPSFRGRVAERILSFSEIVLSSVVVRRTCIDQVGFFDEALMIAEDWDLYFRLAMDYPVDFIDEPLVFRLIHEKNLQHDFSKIERSLEDQLRVVRRMYSHPRLSGPHSAARRATVHRILFGIGEWYFEQYRMGPARRNLIRSLFYHPIHWRTYGMLAKSLLGGAGLKVAQGTMKLLRRIRGLRPAPAPGRPVRVLYVQDLAQARTGSPQSLLDILSRLDRTRYEPISLTNEQGEFTSSLESLRVPFEIARFIPLSRRAAAGFTLSSLRLALWMLRERIDLVHLNSALWRSSVIAAARLLGIPVVQHVRTLWPDLEITERYFLPMMARFIACSRGAADRFMNDPLLFEKMRVVPNGVDLEKISSAPGRLRAEHGLAASVLLVGIIGVLKPIKDQETFIRMAHRVHEAGVQSCFFIVGADPLPGEPYLSRLRGLVKEKGLDGVVRFTGFRQDNLDVIQSLDVVVSASTEEAMPRNLIEAMALSRPVVATPVGGVPELVEEGVTGFLVPVGDADAMAKAVLRLAGDPELRSRLGSAGRRRVEKDFSLERVIEGIEAVYSELLG
jgi:glycosyltransferase involved in cell wall biosynthesis